MHFGFTTMEFHKTRTTKQLGQQNVTCYITSFWEKKQIIKMRKSRGPKMDPCITLTMVSSQKLYEF